jgi:hypothetical protein
MSCRLPTIDRLGWLRRHSLRTVALLGSLTAISGTLPTCSPSRVNAYSARNAGQHEESDSISGVKFSCPKGFSRMPTDETYRVAYLTYQQGNLALFVAPSPAKDGDAYVRRLGTFLVSYLFPEEWAIFAWKDLGPCDKVSKFETSEGWLQGFNGSQRDALLYRSISIEGKQITVGYIFGLDNGTAAQSAFEQGVAAQSTVGQEALSHLIASITHETL